MFLVDYLWDSMVEFLYEVLILNGDIMIEELNQQLKSMYLEPKTKLRVDVDYVIGRLQEIVCVGETMYSADANKHLLSIPTWELEEFIDELKENNDNHNKRLEEIENGN